MRILQCIYSMKKAGLFPGIVLPSPRVIGSFVATIVSQGGAALGGMGLAAALGHLGGPEELGRFTVVVSLLGMLGMIARRGQAALVTRGAAWSMHQEGRGASIALLTLAIRRIFMPSAIMGAGGSALLWSGLLGSPYPGSILCFPIVLLLVTALAVFAGYSRGTGRPWLAPWFEMGGISLVTAIMLTTVIIVWGRVPGILIMGIFLIAMLFLAGLAMERVRRDFPAPFHLIRATDKHREELQRGQFAFSVSALGGFLIQSGSFVVAVPFLTEGDIGLLRAGERLALLVVFPVLAITPVIVSRVVTASRNNNVSRLRRLICGAMLAAGGLGAPILLGLLIWPESALALMGSGFESAANYLRIMALTQYLAAVSVPIVLLLNMSGQERISMWINLTALVVSLIMIPILSAYFGAFGFAMAYSAVIVIRCCLFGAALMFVNRKESSRWSRKVTSGV